MTFPNSKSHSNFLLDYIELIIQIGETIADKSSGKPLPAIKVEEPTVKMEFSINTTPFVGREVYLQSRFLIF